MCLCRDLCVKENEDGLVVGSVWWRGGGSANSERVKGVNTKS